MEGHALLKVGDLTRPPSSIEVYGFENEQGKSVIVRMVNATAIGMHPRQARYLAIELLRKADEIESRATVVGEAIKPDIFNAG